jgi:outer membrane protein assembly factor BamA
MIIHALLITAFALVAQDPIQGTVIRQVQVKGNSRVPEMSILALVSAVPNESLDRTNFREDVHKLHYLGRFENIEVHREYVGQGKVDITYQVSEFPFISSFGIEGVNGSVEDRIHDYLREKNLELHAAMPFSPSIGKKVAGAIRHLLRSLKYPNASVQITATKRGDSVRVLARIETGSRLEVGAVHFKGNHAVSGDTLLGRMQHTRPSAFWIPWRVG